MKTTITLLSFLLAAHIGVSQSQAVLDFHEKFRDNGKYMSVRIDGGLLKLFSNIETNDEEAQDLMDAMEKIEAIDIHAINREDDGFKESDLNKFKKEVKKENYDELMIVRDGDTKLDFLIKEKRGKISDLLLLIDEEDEFVIVNISGEIDLNTIAKITDNLDIKGGKHMKKLEEKE